MCPYGADDMAQRCTPAISDLDVQNGGPRPSLTHSDPPAVAVTRGRPGP